MKLTAIPGIDLLTPGVVAMFGAIVFRQVDSPLPWLLGPLFAVGAARLAGRPLQSPGD